MMDMVVPRGPPASAQHAVGLWVRGRAACPYHGRQKYLVPSGVTWKSRLLRAATYREILTVMRRKIALFATGGTISMVIDKSANAAVPSLNGRNLLNLIPHISHFADVDVFDVSLVGGSQITPDMIFTLRSRVDALLASDLQYDGVVVTQGTDTIEEASYMMDLLLETTKPVVHTAAMRNNSEVGPDGLRNLIAAILTAASPSAANMGVLVVANDQIYGAVDVMKTHTLNSATFAAPDRGPLGYVMLDRERVVLFHSSIIRQKIRPTRIRNNIPIIKFGFGMDASLFSAALDQGCDGVVLEAAGAGNGPEDAEPVLERARQSGIPVVLASRCPAGFVADIYGYPGAGKRLTSRGAILAQGLSAVKARVKLMLLLGTGADMEAIRMAFEYLY